MSAVSRVIDHLPRPVLRRGIHALWKYQEPELSRLDDYLPVSRTAVDVGTWWGPWTAAMAKRCPRVHSFEPQPSLAEQLREWVPSHVTVHECALSDHPGVAELSRSDARPGSDGLATLRPLGGAATISVDVDTIDNRELQDVGFMKIDVEGFELPALSGAEATILRDQPRLMIEIEQRHLDRPIDDVFDWLTSRGYSGHFLRGAARPFGGGLEWYPLDDFDVERDQLAVVDNPKSSAYINGFLFTPPGDGWAP